MKSDDFLDEDELLSDDVLDKLAEGLPAVACIARSAMGKTCSLWKRSEHAKD